MEDQPGEITRLLQSAADGDESAFARAIELVHDDLKRVAQHHLARAYGARAGDVTLEPSALVNEAFLRLVRQRKPLRNRAHLFALATRVMLRALVDYQRERAAQRRGGGSVRVTLGDPAGPEGGALASPSDLLDALERLEALDARKCAVVKLRAIWGFGMEEIAEMLGMSLPTVERDWRFARAWLIGDLRGSA